MSPDNTAWLPEFAQPRRDFFRNACCGFGGLALASLLHDEQARADTGSPPGGRTAPTDDPLTARAPHRPGKAKSVIFLFMAGGPSHLETFDPKPLLNKLDGQPRPATSSAKRSTSSFPRATRAARHEAHVRASTARAASKSPTSFRTRPAASTTSPSFARATATWWSTPPRSTNCSPAGSCRAFPAWAPG